MDSTVDPILAEAMNRLWAKFLPQLEERVAAIEAGGVALENGALTSEIRTEAGSAAHKLAGVLGTFGLGEGSELAREAELFFAGNDPRDAAGGKRMAEIVTQLRGMLAAKRD